ncbi:MAG: hypothetical protein ACLQVD_04430 [Capsulimonadaceae bacterium]
MDNRDEEQIIDEFIGSAGRASEWAALRNVLRERLRALLAKPWRGNVSLEREVAAMREQIAVLEREAAISRFVEDSVRATLHSASPGGDDEAVE